MPEKNSKNKLVNSFELDWSFDELLENIDPSEYKDFDYSKYDQAYAQTNDGKMIQCFLYLRNGIPTIIPEPEPSLMFLKNAESKVNDILKYKEEVFFSMKHRNIYKASDIFSLFFNLSFDCLINLFSSIEAFNNSVIPDNYTIRHRRKFFDREKIQKFIGFQKKTEIIVPEIFKKSFIENKEKYDSIKKLKYLRDNLIHTKNQSNNWQASYRSIYRDILDFNYEDTVKVVKDYMNFYQEGWVENV